MTLPAPADTLMFREAAEAADVIAAQFARDVSGCPEVEIVAVASDCLLPGLRIPRLDLNDPAAIADFIVSTVQDPVSRTPGVGDYQVFIESYARK